MTAPAPPLAISRRGQLVIVPFHPRVQCCACQAILTLGESEPVPTAPGQRRCRDEDACRQRYTPRRLARSTRRLP